MGFGWLRPPLGWVKRCICIGINSLTLGDLSHSSLIRFVPEKNLAAAGYVLSQPTPGAKSFKKP
jgi:hypothetical protein